MSHGEDFRQQKAKSTKKVILRNPPLATKTRIDIQLVPACTTLASTVNTLYDLLLPKLLGYSANTSGGKIVITWLHAPQAAKTFITRLQFRPKT